jgi:hypothetical protein
MHVLKPDDLVSTPRGRLARVLEILPGHKRLCRYECGDRGEFVLAAGLLKLQESAKPRRWLERRREAALVQNLYGDGGG